LNSSLGTGYYGIGINYKGQGTTGNYQDLPVFSDIFYNVKIGGKGGPDLYYYRGGADNCIFGSNCYMNIIDIDFIYDSTIGTNFRNNEIYSEQFGGNVIQNTFSDNIINSNFNSNLIGSSFTSNFLQGAFASNNVLSNFRNNTIKTNIQSTSFTASTYVYGDYNCEIFKRSNGTTQLSYIDGTNTVTYSVITA